MHARTTDLADWTTLVALLPLAAILLAAFVRVAVVLSVLRSAFGGSSLPRSVTAVLALALSGFIMAPVAEPAWNAAGAGLARGDAAGIAESAAAAREPLRRFLAEHTPARERQSFLDLARRLRSSPANANAATVDERDLTLLVPAFILAELKAAFLIGFLLFLPFLVLELLVAGILTSLGMYALDPRQVALPFKLLLFVAADGWHLLCRGLVLGYT